MFERKAASSGMVGIVTKRGKRMIRVFGYLKASISQTSGEVEICITSALKGKPCQVSNDILETLFALQVPDNGVNSQSKRERPSRSTDYA